MTKLEQALMDARPDQHGKRWAGVVKKNRRDTLVAALGPEGTITVTETDFGRCLFRYRDWQEVADRYSWSPVNEGSV